MSRQGVESTSQCVTVNIYLKFTRIQMIKNSPAMWKTWVRSLGWEQLLEKGMATHSSVLAWRISMDRGAWLATFHGVAESDMTEQLSAAHHIFKA